jgi:hypothetical protein
VTNGYTRAHAGASQHPFICGWGVGGEGGWCGRVRPGGSWMRIGGAALLTGGARRCCEDWWSGGCCNSCRERCCETRTVGPAVPANVRDYAPQAETRTWQPRWLDPIGRDCARTRQTRSLAQMRDANVRVSPVERWHGRSIRASSSNGETRTVGSAIQPSVRDYALQAEARSRGPPASRGMNAIVRRRGKRVHSPRSATRTYAFRPPTDPRRQRTRSTR